MAKNKYKVDNIVRISKTDKIENYIFSIISRMHPKIYNEFKCIKIQTTDNRLDFTEMVIRKVSWCGLKETARINTRLKISPREGDSYWLENAWEITLKKIPVLERQGEEWEDD